jgi:hypothetical protein
LPAAFWRRALAGAAGWTGYTHQWQTCDQRFRELVMASVDSVDELLAAQRRGWRTFRARPIGGELLASEFQCPAADESGHRTTCRRCRLCRGLASPAKSVSLELHGARFKSANGDQWLAAKDSLGLLRTHLEAGDPVELPSTPRDASRVRFALSMYYRRRNDPRRISVRAIRPGIFEFSVRS